MEEKKQTELLRRLKSIAGHLRGVEKMIIEEAYCIDIISQVQAVQAALNKVNMQILDDHLHSCLITAVRGDDANERAKMLAEIANVFEKSTKL